MDYCFTKMMNGEKVSSTWSEEDVAYRDELTDFFEHCGELHQPQENVVKWLKSLKERTGWKPSDEHMKALHDLNLTGKISYVGQGQVLIELYNDLKKLK